MIIWIMVLVLSDEVSLEPSVLVVFDSLLSLWLEGQEDISL